MPGDASKACSVQAGLLVSKMPLSGFGAFPVSFLGGHCVLLCMFLALGSGVLMCASFTH